jgi:Zn finger protein HypA/HybF involved in hydrogenase expression
MFKQPITPNDIGTYYATENAQLPSIKCPRCESVTPLQKLASNRSCENCGMRMDLRLVAGSED